MVFPKLKRKSHSKKFYFLILLFAFSSFSFAKSGDDHSWDMLSVLGLYSETDMSASWYYYNTLSSLFSTINDTIDKYNRDNFYDNLKNDFPYFSWGIYGHRLINHWGFDLDVDLDSEGTPNPTQYPNSLSLTFEEKFRNWYGDDIPFLISDWNRFLKVLRDEQALRKTQLTNKVKQTLGLSLQASTDVAAILYYTHLIGDHIEHEGNLTGESVLEIEKIVNSLDTHVKSLAKKSSWLYDDYYKQINTLTKTSDSVYAQKIMDILCICIPKILKTNFSREFANKNIYFCFDEDLLYAS